MKAYYLQVLFYSDATSADEVPIIFAMPTFTGNDFGDK